MSKSKNQPITRIEPYGIYDIQQAADSIGISKRTVQQYIREGRIGARKAGKEYRMTGDSILSFLGSPTISRMSISDLSTQGKSINELLELDK